MCTAEVDEAVAYYRVERNNYRVSGAIYTPCCNREKTQKGIETEPMNNLDDRIEDVAIGRKPRKGLKQYWGLKEDYEILLQ